MRIILPEHAHIEPCSECGADSTVIGIDDREKDWIGVALCKKCLRNAVAVVDGTHGAILQFWDNAHTDDKSNEDAFGEFFGAFGEWLALQGRLAIRRCP